MPPSAETGSEAKIDIDHVVSLFRKTSYIEQHTWAPVAYSVLLGFGKLTKPAVNDLVVDLLQRTEDAQQLEKTADKDAMPHRLAVFRALREGFLKGAALAGFPRTINALSYLQSSLASNCPAVADILKQDTSLRTPVSLEERKARGWAFFSAVYGEHAEKIFASLNGSSGGDLGEFAVYSVYADLVSETSVLGGKETELLQFICCLSLGADCGPQANGHMHGASKMGNSGEEIRAAIHTVEYFAGLFKVAWKREDMGFLEKANEW